MDPVLRVVCRYRYTVGVTVRSQRDGEGFYLREEVGRYRCTVGVTVRRERDGYAFSFQGRREVRTEGRKEGPCTRVDNVWSVRESIHKSSPLLVLVRKRDTTILKSTSLQIIIYLFIYYLSVKL